MCGLLALYSVNVSGGRLHGRHPVGQIKDLGGDRGGAD